MAAKEHGNSLGDAYRRCSLLGQITERREAGWIGRRTTAGAAFIAIKVLCICSMVIGKCTWPMPQFNHRAGVWVLPRSHSICPDVLRVSRERR